MLTTKFMYQTDAKLIQPDTKSLRRVQKFDPRFTRLLFITSMFLITSAFLIIMMFLISLVIKPLQR